MEKVICERFEILRKNIYDFSEKTFGKGRSYREPLHHLKEEIDEVLESGEESEYADCLLLLLDSYSKRYPKKNVSDLIKSSEDKLEILKERKWNKPDENGVFKHKK
ncbi:MAG: dATP/dGTP pyrophosphohydrolase domain-containing protein [bacterium]